MTEHRDVSTGSHEAGALHEQRELLRVALDNIGDAVITTDVTGNITNLNPIARSLTGWTAEDAVGQPLTTVFQIVDEQTRATVENPIARVLREGVSAGLADHTALIAKDGTKRPIETSAAPIRGATGDVIGVVLVFRDVTERREHGRRVQGTLDVDSILAMAHDPLIVLDHELRVITASRSFYQIFQVTAEETEQRLMYELGDHAWDIPRLRILLEDILPQNHQLNDFRLEHDFPAIGRKVMLLNARRLVQDGDQTDRILLSIEDVTEREQALEMIEGSELKYRRLFEAAQDGILILTADTGRITDANPFIEAILGRSREELIGQQLWNIGLLTDWAQNEEKFEELKNRGYVRYDHLPLETEDGVQTEVEFVSNVYSVGGHQVIQCNIRDITDRRHLERETERQARELADLDHRKDEFLAMLSHELRNPLAPIVNAAQLLLGRTNEDRVQRQAVEVIARQSAQLAHLVDDLLEISRITTGRIQLRRERIALRPLVEQAVGTVQADIKRRGHEFSLSFPPETVWLDADPVRLEQVVVNLLANAAKYTNDGGHIALAVDQEGDFVTIRVRDDGVGIAPEILPNVFDLFAQGERSLARSEGGLGIGLALVKQLTQMHGGFVDVYSAFGHGSEFVVRLPIAPDPERPQAGLPARPAPASDGRSVRVLVVDDSPDMARILQLLIEDEGHLVRVAHDGPTALTAALEFQPAIAFVDIGLPGWDGYEVARRLRREPTLAGLMLVAITGYGRDSDREHAREAGFDRHIVKPPDFEALKKMIATAGK